MFVSRRAVLRRAAVGVASLALLSIGARYGVAHGDEKASAPKAAPQAQVSGRVKHVFIVSFDGGKPSVMKESKMPVLMGMVGEGASSWEAQTVIPSITLVSHTSMLTGLQPAKHKINWNDWVPDKGMITVPTVFSLAKEKGLKTAMFVGKPKFIHLYRPKDVNEFALPSYDAKTVAMVAARYIQSSKPNLCFIHFSDSDGAGHKYGWGTPEQKQAFADEDEALKVVRDAVEKAGIANESVIIMSADHGGHAKTHGTTMPEDMTIPWVAWGAGVKKGFTITDPVSTCDTAATALWLLGVPLPADFDGKPQTGAFTP
jgi:predicted AlkP superfamily pyrophosphatase or phosphodiesterase